MARRKRNLDDSVISDLETITDVLGDSRVNVSGSFDEALHVFLRDCKLRNLSEHTLTYYNTELKWFRKLLEKQGISPNPSDVTIEVVQDNVILFMLETEGCKVGTVNTMLRAVKIFFSFLYKRGYSESDPTKELPYLKERRNAIETFTSDQINDLLRQPNQRTFAGVRDYVMICLFLETGARLRELVEMQTQDIRWEDSQILIHGKNGSDRLVPIQRRMSQELKRWMRVRGDVKDHNFLFINIDNGPISKRQVQSRITKYGRMANITNVRCSPHTLRHTFAKMSVMNGANVFELQDILGHSTLDMVRAYVNLFSRDIYEAHRRFSPLENLRR